MKCRQDFLESSGAIVPNFARWHQARSTPKCPGGSCRQHLRLTSSAALDRLTAQYALHAVQDFDAFQHEIYGDLITVERHIARVGTASAYLLKDGNGK